MKKIWRYIGQLAFWVAYPLLFIYIRFGRRTRVLIIANNKVLVVKGWLGYGQWQLPGGGMHQGELPQDGAVREVREETGIKLDPASLDFLYETTEQAKGLRFYYYCFAINLPKQIPPIKQHWEIIEADWLPLTAITQKNATADTYSAVQAWLRL